MARCLRAKCRHGRNPLGLRIYFEPKVGSFASHAPLDIRFQRELVPRAVQSDDGLGVAVYVTWSFFSLNTSTSLFQNAALSRSRPLNVRRQLVAVVVQLAGGNRDMSFPKSTKEADRCLLTGKGKAEALSRDD